MPDAREGAVCFSLNGKVYWGGGTATTQGNVLKDFYEYDPTADTWTPKADMPEERLWGISFTINGKGYAGLGKTSGSGNSAYLSSLYEYDAATDKWTKKADITAGFGLTQSSVFVANNKAYVLGGTNSNFASYGTLYEYDPATDQWATKAPYPVTNQGANWIRYPFVFGIGSKGYIASGEVRKASGLGTEWTKKAFEYNPATDTWTPIADFPSDGRSAGSAFVINNIAYCGLGYYTDGSFNNVYLKEIYTYNPSTDTWLGPVNFPGSERVLAASAVINNKGYVGGGSKFQSGYVKDWHEVTLPTSVGELNSTNSLVIYPNPTSGNVTIAGINKTYNYTVTNLQGQTLSKGDLNKTNNKISLSPFVSGTYFIHVQDEQRSIWQKVVKQ